MTPHLRLGVLAIILIALAAGVLGWQVYSTHDAAQSTALDEIRRLLDSLTNRPEVLTSTPLRRALTGQGADLTLTGILRETNRHRAAAGLAPLTLNSQLAQAADAKVADMFAQQYFEHESPEGKGPADIISATGYEYIRVGENLALGNFTSDADLVQAWMDSPGHRANILHPGYTEIGLSASAGSFDSHRAWLAVQEFGLPLSACPGVDENLRTTVDRERAALDGRSSTLAALATELERQQAALSALANEVNALRQQGSAKINEGNQQIEEGNRIYEDTGDREQAEPYWQRGEQLQAEGRALLEQADQKESEYRAARDAFEAKRLDYNARITTQQSSRRELTGLIDRLNQQINAFNTCLESTATN